MSSGTSNQSMERTADRDFPPFEMASTLPLRSDARPRCAAAHLVLVRPMKRFSIVPLFVALLTGCATHSSEFKRTVTISARNVA